MYILVPVTGLEQKKISLNHKTAPRPNFDENGIDNFTSIYNK